jgi:MFS superfamily sulfate permease-like transporter
VLTNLLRGGAKGFLKADTQVTTSGDGVTLKLRGALGFNNFVGVRGVLDSLPKGKQLTLDYSGVSFMDHTVRERLHDFKGEYEGAGGSLSVHGDAGLQPSSHHELCAVARVRA